MLLNSRLAYDDREPWSLHHGGGFRPEERFATEVAGAKYKPRTFPVKFPNTLLAKFRGAMRYSIGGPLMLAETWLDYFDEFADEFETGRLQDEMVHARAVLQRIVNVYGEA